MTRIPNSQPPPVLVIHRAKPGGDWEPHDRMRPRNEREAHEQVEQLRERAVDPTDAMYGYRFEVRVHPAGRRIA